MARPLRTQHAESRILPSPIPIQRRRLQHPQRNARPRQTNDRMAQQSSPSARRPQRVRGLRRARPAASAGGRARGRQRMGHRHLRGDHQRLHPRMQLHHRVRRPRRTRPHPHAAPLGGLERGHLGPPAPPSRLGLDHHRQGRQNRAHHRVHRMAARQGLRNRQQRRPVDGADDRNQPRPAKRRAPRQRRPVLPSAGQQPHHPHTDEPDRLRPANHGAHGGHRRILCSPPACGSSERRRSSPTTHGAAS